MVRRWSTVMAAMTRATLALLAVLGCAPVPGRGVPDPRAADLALDPAPQPSTPPPRATAVVRPDDDDAAEQPPAWCPPRAMGATATPCRLLPTIVAGLGQVDLVAVGPAHSCARGGGEVRCWGVGLWGALGTDREAQAAGAVPVAPEMFTFWPTPRPVAGLVATDVRELAVGSGFTLARMADGAVHAWGFDVVHVGSALRHDTNMPARVPGLDDARALAAGRYHACALTSTDRVRCWGAQHVGQLGRRPGAEDPVPAIVPAVRDAEQLAAGGDATCARLGEGTVACWGARDAPWPRGDVGRVAGLASVAQVALGERHACVRSSDGTVRCWGANASGQLGDATTLDRARPVVVQGLAGVVEIALGSRHACARLSDGTVSCWGANASGQLGDGTTVDRARAVAVVGLRDATDVYASGERSCARTADARLWCWGGEYAPPSDTGSR